MLNRTLKSRITPLLISGIQTPGQYIGGELNSRIKTDSSVRGKLCFAFPDAYSIGMSHHGLHLLYGLMNDHTDWACERVFTPWPDMEQLLRRQKFPLYSLETFTPLSEFDVVGFSLQYELAGTNMLTILDLGRIPLCAIDRTLDDPLVIAGGPVAMNPEPFARFIDLFVIGDGEETLPAVCDAWLDARRVSANRREALLRLACELPNIYVPRFYESADIYPSVPEPTEAGVPAIIASGTVSNLDAVPLPTRPVVPMVETVQDRITIELMRGCPWSCLFCQSRPIKWPVRFRSVDSIVRAARETYANTGYDEISLLSLSTSDYPYLEELITRLQNEFRPLGVSIAVPSLRVNEHLVKLSRLLNTDRHNSLTLAPEAAREPLRGRIGKRITNEDLFDGCRHLFAEGFDRVKLYFMCGLPGETKDDLDGIVEMADAISTLGKEVRDRFAKVSVSVSNFVPKPHTGLSHTAMARPETFREAHHYLKDRRLPRSISLRYHDLQTSLLEGVIARGDRRLGPVIESTWRAGARFDAWREYAQPDRWWAALKSAEIDLDRQLYTTYDTATPMPWSHIGLRGSRK